MLSTSLVARTPSPPRVKGSSGWKNAGGIWDSAFRVDLASRQPAASGSSRAMEMARCRSR